MNVIEEFASHFENKNDFFVNDTCLDFVSLESPLNDSNIFKCRKRKCNARLFHLKEKKLSKKSTKKINKKTSFVSFKLENKETESLTDNNSQITAKRHIRKVSKVKIETEDVDEVFIKQKYFPYDSFGSKLASKSSEKLPWTLASLSLYMSDNKAALQFCQERKLLPTSKQCPVCHDQMLISEKLSSDKGLGYVFRCSRRACQIVRSARSGTWFAKSKLPIRKSLLLTYCFASNFPFNVAVHESSFTAGCTSPTTVSDWYSYCREVCTHAMSCQMSVRLGGEQCIVEMDEITIGKKCTKKRIIEGQIIIGFYCRLTGRVSVACIPKNKKDCNLLVPIIENFVNMGTIIHLSCWNPEEVLGPGYHHLYNNYNMQFVVLENGNPIAGIEKVWRLLKLYDPQIENKKKADQLYSYLCEFLWRRWIDMNRLDPFETFLDDAAILYMLPDDKELSC